MKIQTKKHQISVSLSTRREGDAFKSRIVFDRELNIEILVSEYYDKDFEVELFKYYLENGEWNLEWISDVANHKIEEYCWYYLDRLNNSTEHEGQKYYGESLNLS